MAYFLGIDIGTYESKGCLVDENLRVVRTAVARHGLSVPRPGWAEHDAEGIWWKDFVTLSQELLSEPKTRDLVAVGCSAIAPTMLPVDAEGRPLRPAILYGIDTRAHKEIQELEDALGKDWIEKRCWNELSSQSVGPKILWFKKNEPQLFRKTWKVMTATTYLVFKLTGQVVVDFYTACAFTPLLDLNELRWNDELGSILAPPHMLPDLRWTAEVAGKVTREAAVETGIPAGTPVIVGTADAAAEFVSTGAGAPGDMMLMLGSTVFFILQLSRPLRAEGLWSSVFLWPGSFCIAGGMATGGALTRWFRDNFAAEETARERETGENAYEILWRRAAEVPPGGPGLVVLPYFSGERTPVNDPKARGVIIGLSLSHNKYSVYRALLEGIAFGIRHNVECVERVASPKRLLGVGGGTKNPLWLRIIASVLRRELLLPPVRTGASFGDALLAALSQGALRRKDLVTLFSGAYEKVRPDEELARLYEEYYVIYRGLWEDISTWVHRAADLGGA
ncbi:FGGY-family carbohydrate kinase [Candidatus Bipolaricaulota bacterium]|nr:FGGY-family carbohydrate kinase [Candidatus Bipolaricaulota bacterium]